MNDDKPKKESRSHLPWQSHCCAPPSESLCSAAPKNKRVTGYLRARCRTKSGAGRDNRSGLNGADTTRDFGQPRPKRDTSKCAHYAAREIRESYCKFGSASPVAQAVGHGPKAGEVKVGCAAAYRGWSSATVRHPVNR